jgi:GTP-binding protein Era
VNTGIVTLVGRPNVGKSTLINRLVGRKVSIVSSRPQTTRAIVRGVVNDIEDEWQMVLVHTPGLHRPRTELGSRLNRLVQGTLTDADVICFLIDAAQPVGPGDRLIAERCQQTATPTIVCVNKIDKAPAEKVLSQLDVAGAWDFAAYVPVSAQTGKGLDALLSELTSRLPEGPALFPPDLDTDQPEEFLIAEIIREKFLDQLREELPHSLHVRITSMEDIDEVLHVEADLLVERQSQKGIVIGKGGSMLERAGSAARVELEGLLATRIHLQLRARVEPDWQRRPAMLDRLGFSKE